MRLWQNQGDPQLAGCFAITPISDDNWAQWGKMSIIELRYRPAIKERVIIELEDLRVCQSQKINPARSKSFQFCMKVEFLVHLIFSIGQRDMNGLTVGANANQQHLSKRRQNGSWMSLTSLFSGTWFWLEHAQQKEYSQHCKWRLMTELGKFV